MRRVKKTTDVLIIGGGIIGCAIAETLAREGKSVALIERGMIGRESSWAAAGMLAPQSEMPEPCDYFDFCLASRRMYPAVVERVREASGIDPQYRPEGMLYAAFNEAEEKILLERAAWQRPLGANARALTREEARALEPALTSDIRMAVHFQEDHQLDPRLMTRAYMIAARKAGAHILECTPACGLVVESGRVMGARLAQGEMRAQWTILAGGAWSGVLADLSFRIPLYPVKGQMILFQCATPPFRHTLHSPGIYLAPRLDGRVIAGATEEHDSGFDKSVRADAVHGLIERAFGLAPKLRDAELADSWSGLRPGTEDKRAILGECPMEGLLLATGHFRNGILLAPITAARIAEFITTARWASDMRAFSIMRFANDERVTREVHASAK